MLWGACTVSDFEKNCLKYIIVTKGHWIGSLNALERVDIGRWLDCSRVCQCSREGRVWDLHGSA